MTDQIIIGPNGQSIIGSLYRRQCIDFICITLIIASIIKNYNFSLSEKLRNEVQKILDLETFSTCPLTNEECCYAFRF